MLLLARLTKTIRSLHRLEANKRVAAWTSKELQQAIRRGDAHTHTHTQWRICTLLARSRNGPKHRRYAQPLTQQPLSSDWERFLEQEGQFGGCSASTFDYQQTLEDMIEQSLATPNMQHFQQSKSGSRCSKKSRACKRIFVKRPSEDTYLPHVYQQKCTGVFFIPNYRIYQDQLGIGFSRDKEPAEVWYQQLD